MRALAGGGGGVLGRRRRGGAGTGSGGGRRAERTQELGFGRLALLPRLSLLLHQAEAKGFVCFGHAPRPATRCHLAGVLALTRGARSAGLVPTPRGGEMPGVVVGDN